MKNNNPPNFLGISKNFKLGEFPEAYDLFNNRIREGSIILKYDRKKIKICLVLGACDFGYDLRIYILNSEDNLKREDGRMLVTSIRLEELSKSVIFTNSLFYLHLEKIAIILDLIDYVKDHPYNKNDFFLNHLTKEQIIQGDVHVEV